MADDQEPSNDIGEEGDQQDAFDYDDTTAAVIETTTTSSVSDDYDDEPIEDYVVKLVVNEQPDGAILDAAVTDINGNVVSPTTKLYDSINEYTTALIDEMNGNGTAITGGKRWWGWSTTKLIIIGLIALCILGVILAILFFVFGKKFSKNKRQAQAGPTTTTKAVVTKGVTPDPKYQPVPNV